jgi:hypothetical protein
MSSTNRRSFLVGGAALAAVPAVASLAGESLTGRASADTLNEDVPLSIAAPDTAMAYPWEHFIGGHMGRLGTRADMVLYQQYVNDIIDGVKKALATVDPTPYFAKYGNNVWAASQQYLAAVVAYASGPVIKKHLGVLAAADVYTASTTFAILESVRLDLGAGSQVHA